MASSVTSSTHVAKIVPTPKTYDMPSARKACDGIYGGKGEVAQTPGSLVDLFAILAGVEATHVDSYDRIDRSQLRDGSVMIG